LQLKNGEYVQEHVKAMIEEFEGLSVIGDPVSEEDHAVFASQSARLVQNAGPCF